MGQLFTGLMDTIEGFQKFNKELQKELKEEEILKKDQKMYDEFMRKRWALKYEIIDAKDYNGLTSLMISALKRDKDAVEFFIFDLNANPTIEQDDLKETAAGMLEYDLIPDTSTQLQTWRKRILEVLRNAEDSQVRHEKIARLQRMSSSVLHLSTADLKAAGINWPENLRKDLLQYPSLKIFDSKLGQLFENMRKELLQSKDKLEIKRKFFDQYLATEAFYNLMELKERRKDTLAERFRTAKLLGVPKTNDTLSEIENIIWETKKSSTDEDENSLLLLYNFIENHMLKQLYSDLNIKDDL